VYYSTHIGTRWWGYTSKCNFMAGQQDGKSVSSQKVGATPCGCPPGQAHPQVPVGEGLPLPQDIEKIRKSLRKLSIVVGGRIGGLVIGAKLAGWGWQQVRATEGNRDKR
jgi:hypothetical protein